RDDLITARPPAAGRLRLAHGGRGAVGMGIWWSSPPPSSRIRRMGRPTRMGLWRPTRMGRSRRLGRLGMGKMSSDRR
ncbi:hypothetical protein PMAYCL1PPCAC_32055, partial [Pristionchus mayeri]